jgi:hypothetical protein
MENELGRELMAHELKERTVVVLQKEGRPMFTSWVSIIEDHFVAFTAGVTKTTLLLKRNSDGTLEDDTPARIKVFEYLGEV